MNKVKLVATTKPEVDGLTSSEDLVSYCARVSNPNNQLNTNTGAGLLNYCLRHKHFSIFEMANVVVEINTTRDISRQILRHRSLSFQEFCLHGDSEVTTVTKSGRTKKVPIKDLYKRYNSKQYSDMSDWLVRVYDEESNSFIVAKIKEVFQTGVKSLHNLKLEGNKSIVSTLEHKYLVRGKGFIPLSDITCDDFVAVNGQPVYQSKEWMSEAKSRSISSGKGVQGIADEAGCSYHTIRKWLKLLDLNFSYKESASCNKIWNKGLPKEMQPRYGKTVNDEVRARMSTSAKNRGCDWDVGAGRDWYKEVRDYWYKRKYRLYQGCNGVCADTGEIHPIESLEIDHILPVATNPEKAYDEDNIQLLCKESHKEKTNKETQEMRHTVRYKKVISIKYHSDDQTYDLEVNHSSHNYIANGIVTHNSGRYSEMDNELVPRETRMQDVNNKQGSLESTDDYIVEHFTEEQKSVWKEAVDGYNYMLSLGIAKEQARALLPEGLVKTRMYANGTLRSWIHYCQVRCGIETQKEHRMIAKQVCQILIEQFPVMENYLSCLLEDGYSAEH